MTELFVGVYLENKAVGNGRLALLQHPEQMQQLCADPFSASLSHRGIVALHGSGESLLTALGQ